MAGTDAYPVGIATGDLDGDSFVDVVVADSGGQRLEPFLNHRTGSFERAPVVLAGEPHTAVALGKVDGDNVLDLLATSVTGAAAPAGHRLSIYHGVGDGTFGAKGDIFVGRESSRIATAFVDPDAFLDIVTSNFTSADITVVTGNGTVMPTVATSYPTSGNNARGVAIGELSDMPGLDIAVPIQAGGMDVFVNLGDGTFPTRSKPSMGISARDVQLFDLDDDGRLDMLVPSVSPTEGLIVMHALGSGTYDTRTIPIAGRIPNLVHVGDVDGDGRADAVVVGGGADSYVIVLYGDRTIAGLGAERDEVKVPGELVDVALIDVAGDPSPDLVTITRGPDVLASFTTQCP